MIIKSLTYLFILMTLVPGLFAQNAPVATAPVKTSCPGSQVVIPITVTGFTSIGSVSLTLKFNPAVLSMVSAVNTAGFPGLSFGYGIPGKVVISGYSSSGITYADNSVLFTLILNYLGGSTELTWYDTGITCEYTGFPGYATLNDLPFEDYYINGQVSPDFEVSFSAGNLLPLEGETVAFTDLSAGAPTAWNWSISPANHLYVNGTNAASQNPEVQFTLNGPFTVSLTATKGTCSITKTVNNYIHCGISGRWTGITSGDWNIPSNWHNYLVPASSTNVVVPSATQNWPVYDGDLTIGSQINSLTLQGISSMLTVTGHLTILSAN